jgi:hypothetical protein
MKIFSPAKLPSLLFLAAASWGVVGCPGESSRGGGIIGTGGASGSAGTGGAATTGGAAGVGGAAGSGGAGGATGGSGGSTDGGGSGGSTDGGGFGGTLNDGGGSGGTGGGATNPGCVVIDVGKLPSGGGFIETYPNAGADNFQIWIHDNPKPGTPVAVTPPTNHNDCFKSANCLQLHKAWKTGGPWYIATSGTLTSSGAGTSTQGVPLYPFTQDATGVMTIDQTSKDCFWIASASSQ